VTFCSDRRACQFILNNRDRPYSDTCTVLRISSLYDRRHKLSETFQQLAHSTDNCLHYLVLDMRDSIITNRHRSANKSVSLKHDGPDGTVKMANLPVPSVSTDGTDCPVCLWQTGQADDCWNMTGQTGHKRKEAKMHRRKRRKSETNYDMQRCPLRFTLVSKFLPDNGCKRPCSSEP